jgi:hypothetical protein
MAVYLVETQGLYKIGIAKSPSRRLGELQVGCPFELNLINTFDGDSETESYIHKVLSVYRIRGEWFDLPEAISEWLINADFHDLTRVYAADLLLRKDLSYVYSKSKVERIRQRMKEFIDGCGLQDWRKKSWYAQ